MFCLHACIHIIQTLVLTIIWCDVLSYSSVGVYLQVLILVITRDVKNFILMFIVINLAFGGSLYFALRGEVDDTNNNSTDFDPILDTSLSTHTDETK